MKNFILKLGTLLCFFLVNVLPAQSYVFNDWEDPENPGPMGTVYLEGRFLDGDLLQVSVYAEDMRAPVLGIAFHLKYEAEKLSFLRYDPGNFLEIGGDPFYMVSNDELKQKIIFGETLRREDSFPLGGDKIADFYFQILDEEEFSFSFENAVVSTLDVVRQDMANISWNDLYLNKNSYEISENPEGEMQQNDEGKTSLLTSHFELFIAAVMLITLSSVATVLLIRKRLRAGRQELTE